MNISISIDLMWECSNENSNKVDQNQVWSIPSEGGYVSGEFKIWLLETVIQMNDLEEKCSELQLQLVPRETLQERHQLNIVHFIFA